MPSCLEDLEDDGAHGGVGEGLRALAHQAQQVSCGKPNKSNVCRLMWASNYKPKCFPFDSYRSFHVPLMQQFVHFYWRIIVYIYTTVSLPSSDCIAHYIFQKSLLTQSLTSHGCNERY